jgi:hypothetical protein
MPQKIAVTCDECGGAFKIYENEKARFDGLCPVCSARINGPTPRAAKVGPPKQPISQPSGPRSQGDILEDILAALQSIEKMGRHVYNVWVISAWIGAILLVIALAGIFLRGR